MIVHIILGLKGNVQVLYKYVFSDFGTHLLYKRLLQPQHQLTIQPRSK